MSACGPRHVAVVMDGNGRWALRRGMTRAEGHRAGTKNVPEILEAAAQAGIGAVTLYSFSTENWARPKAEVGALMALFAGGREQVLRMHERGARVRFVGRREGLPGEVVGVIEEAEGLTERNERLDVYVALNYGAKAEIVDAVRRLVASGVAPEELDEAAFARRLYAPEATEVDLLIRAGAEMRLSNFVLWQAARAEIYFTDTLWPDFTARELSRALEFYADRKGVRL